MVAGAMCLICPRHQRETVEGVTPIFSAMYRFVALFCRLNSDSISCIFIRKVYHRTGGQKLVALLLRMVNEWFMMGP